MAVTIRDLIRNPGLAARFFAALHASSVRRCGCGCGRELSAAPGETERMGDGRALRADCYWAALGAELEAHPLGPGRRVRSALAGTF